MKPIYLIIIAVIIIVLVTFYFTNTTAGLSQRIMWKYPPQPGTNPQEYKAELSGLTIQELKDILKYGGQ